MTAVVNFGNSRISKLAIGYLRENEKDREIA